MATFYVDGNSAVNGSGTELSPFNAVAGNSLTGSNTWLFKRGSSLNMGAATLASGNSVIMGAYGAGPRPIITGTGNLWSCSTANSAIVVEDIHFLKAGATGSTGVDASLMSGGSASFTMRRCRVEGFIEAFKGERSLRITLDTNEFVGDSSSYGVVAKANSNNNCDNWVVSSNEFRIGGAFFLEVSNSTTQTGSFNNLIVRGNKFFGGSANSINLASPTSQSNSALYLSVTAPSTVQAFSDAAGTIPAALPAWGVGSKVFLAGFSDRANFGLLTVASVSSNTLVVSETSLQTESRGQNKGIHVRDATRAFNNVLIEDNVLNAPPATPMNLNACISPVVRRNKILGATGTSVVSAGIELINVLRGSVYENEITGLTVSASVQAVDGMGIMIDGASEDCGVYRNRISSLSGLPGVENSGAGLALFECKNCHAFSNIVTDCKNGAWVGGPGTTGSVRNNTLADCGEGIEVNSSPATGVIGVSNNLIAGNDAVGTVSSAGTSTNNWFWNNATGSSFGTNAQTTDPLVRTNYIPLAASGLFSNGSDLGYIRDITGVLGKKFVGAWSTKVEASERGVRT